MGLLADDVSRETKERLESFHGLLLKWNPRINLVSESTLKDAWTRHFEDSIQITRIMDQPPKLWLDIGSGGGFPGLVVAIVLHEVSPTTDVILMEADQRKCVFLRTVIRETGLQSKVVSARIEKAPPMSADVISARALGSLDQLLGFADRHGHQGTKSLFPKGASWQQEVAEAKKAWSFKHSVHKSQTNPEAVILEIEEIEHV